MMKLRVEFDCGACIARLDDQPNYCRKCGGTGRLETTLSMYQLSRMGEIPTTVRGIVTAPRTKKRRARA